MDDPKERCGSCGYPRECHEPGWHNDDCAAMLGADCDCCVAYVCKTFLKSKSFVIKTNDVIDETGKLVALIDEDRKVYEIVCDQTNNPPSNVEKGVVTIDVKLKERF